QPDRVRGVRVWENHAILIAAQSVGRASRKTERLQGAHEYRKHIPIDRDFPIFSVEPLLEVVNVDIGQSHGNASRFTGCSVVLQVWDQKTWTLKSVKLFVELAWQQ